MIYSFFFLVLPVFPVCSAALFLHNSFLYTDIECPLFFQSCFSGFSPISTTYFIMSLFIFQSLFCSYLFLFYIYMFSFLSFYYIVSLFALLLLLAYSFLFFQICLFFSFVVMRSLSCGTLFIFHMASQVNFSFTHTCLLELFICIASWVITHYFLFYFIILVYKI